MKLRKWRLLIGGTNSRIETFLPCFMHILYICICRLHVKMTYLDNRYIVFIRLFLFNNLIYVSYFLVNWAMNNAENMFTWCTRSTKVYLYQKCLAFQAFHPPPPPQLPRKICVSGILWNLKLTKWVIDFDIFLFFYLIFGE